MLFTAKKNLFFLVLLLFFFISTFLYIIFFTNLPIPFVDNVWKEKEQIYEYRVNENLNSFTVEGYLSNITQKSNQDAIQYAADFVIYKKDILENLNKTFEIENPTINLEADKNYKITFQIDNRFEKPNMSFELITQEELEKNIFSHLFKSFNYNISGFTTIEMLSQFPDLPTYNTEEIEEDDTDLMKITGVPYSIDILKQQISLLYLKNKKDLDSDLSNIISTYLEENKEKFSMEESRYKCLSSTLIGNEHVPEEIKDLPLEPRFDDMSVDNLIDTLYYEDADEPVINDNLKILLDKILYCDTKYFDLYVKEFEKLKNQLSFNKNINKETIFLLYKISASLKDFIDTKNIDISQYLEESEINYFSDTNLLICIKEACNKDRKSELLPMSLKIENDKIYFVYDFSTKEVLNPSLIMLSILL